MLHNRLLTKKEKIIIQSNNDMCIGNLRVNIRYLNNELQILGTEKEKDLSHFVISSLFVFNLLTLNHMKMFT